MFTFLSKRVQNGVTAMKHYQKRILGKSISKDARTYNSIAEV